MKTPVGLETALCGTALVLGNNCCHSLVVIGNKIMWANKPETPKTKLRYSVRGKRFQFFDAQGVDELVSINMALAQELWVVKERQATMEAVAAAKGIVLPKEIEDHEFSEDQKEALEAERKVFIDRIFFILREEAEALEDDLDAEPSAPNIP